MKETFFRLISMGLVLAMLGVLFTVRVDAGPDTSPESALTVSPLLSFSLALASNGDPHRQDTYALNEQTGAYSKIIDQESVPEFVWNKRVYVNDVLTDAISITVFPSDTVEIVDQVWITYTGRVTFTLAETWTKSLGQIGWANDAGDVITTANTLTWEVTDAVTDTWYAITKTFTVLEDDWTFGYMTETLTVEGADPQPDDRVLILERGDICLPVSIIGLESDSPVNRGNVMHFTSTTLGDSPIFYAWIFDDGTTSGPSTGLDTVTHTYSADGTYTVTLDVVNYCQKWLTDSASIVVRVNPPPPPTYIYLPVVLRNFFINPYEDYDSRDQAYGPLEPGTDYCAYPDDDYDWYYFVLSESAAVTVQVTGYQAEGQLRVYDEGGSPIPGGFDWNEAGGDGVMTTAPLNLDGGKYYIRIYTASGQNTDALYTLTVTY